MEDMQHQVATLSAAVHALTKPESPSTMHRPSVIPPSHARNPIRRLSSAKEATFQGPTTSAFSFDLAKSSLQQRGIVERNEGADGTFTQEPSPMPSPSPPDPRPEPASPPGDPLYAIKKAEAVRLCHVYEEEMGIMYPVLDLQRLVDQVHLLYDHVMQQRQPMQLSEGVGLDDTDVHILRLVFACALTAEGSGRSERAIRLFDSVREVADNCVWGAPEIKNIIFLTLVVSIHLLTETCLIARRSSTFKWTRKPSHGEQ